VGRFDGELMASSRPFFQPSYGIVSGLPNKAGVGVGRACGLKIMHPPGGAKMMDGFRRHGMMRAPLPAA